MKFRAEVSIPTSNFSISHQDDILLVGSCFSENIGNYLVDNQFNALVNPFGILFNPVSIVNCIDKILEQYTYQEADLVAHNGTYHSFNHHGDFSGDELETVLESINSSVHKAHEFIRKTEYICLTYGTAWVYRHLKTNQVVSNCHKIPAIEFSRELLSVNEIVLLYQDLIQRLRTLNPNVKVIFTVSPVRHGKDGAQQNNISKGTLLLAINELVKQQGVEYFPSYEIVIDELRDYRFYKEDLQHPNNMAVKYVWEKFGATYFSDSTAKLNSEINKIVQGMKHRPIRPNSKEHQQFLVKLQDKINQLENDYPYLSFKLKEL